MGEKKKHIKYEFLKRLLDLFYIWRQEFLYIFREPGVILIFFVATLLYPVLYGVIYHNEALHKIPIAVVDLSHGSQSRRFIRALNAAPELNVAYKCHSLEEAKDLFFRHKAHGIVLISGDFDRNINEGRQTFISGYFDMSSFLYYRNVLAPVTMISKEIGAEIMYENLVSGGMDDAQARATVNPLPYVGVPLFNSGGGFASFLLPAVFILILYQTLMLGINMLAGVYWEEGKYRDLIPINKRYHGTLRIVLGKALCYFTIYLFLAFYVVGVAPRIFNLPHIGSPGTLFVFIIPFLLSTIFLSMTFSVVIRHMESAFLFLLFLTLPLLFLSGISWPQSNIPAFWKVISYLFPSTHGIQGYIRINTMGANLNEVSKEYFLLWLQVGVYFLTACLVYNHQIRLSAKRKK
ncbi:MAG: ABC transporter permease [Candidatus Azobacteroides sp.]|nr:ABC transporter permease [Candidatus Azobacteroides sp.]